MEFNFKNENVIIDENYKVKRFKYSKANFEKNKKVLCCHGLERL